MRRVGGEVMDRVVAFRPFDHQLRAAIAQKRLVRLGYKGKQRLVQPHDYGIKSPGGDLRRRSGRVFSPSHGVG